MYSALLGTDPVVFFESQRLYDMPELFHEGGVPQGAYEIPFGEPDVKRTGRRPHDPYDRGDAVSRSRGCSDELAQKYGVSCESDRRSQRRALQLRRR